MSPRRLQLGIFCVIGRCDNHYSLAPIELQTFKDSESVVKWHLLGVCIIATLFAIEKVVFTKIGGWVVKIGFKSSKWVDFCFWLKKLLIVFAWGCWSRERNYVLIFLWRRKSMFLKTSFAQKVSSDFWSFLCQRRYWLVLCFWLD